MSITSFPKIATSALLLLTSTAYGGTTDTGVQAAWVVLGEQGHATARVITKSAVCPNLKQDNVLTAMHIRAVPATVPKRADQSKPSEFPVLTCELPLAKGVKSASVEGKNLPIPKAELRKIVVLGNTGCRATRHQHCDNMNEWVFSKIAKEAADREPDLVVHTGDYHYREADPWGFGWNAWEADFFTPAAPLLAAAPWVMVRGDRETCAKAGQGWWRFLAPSPLKAGDGRNCNRESNDAIGNYSEPYVVPLGKDADGKSVQLVIFDSADTPNTAFNKDGQPYKVYLNQYRKANQLVQQADHSLFVEHHPILDFGVEYSQMAPNPYYPDPCGPPTGFPIFLDWKGECDEWAKRFKFTPSTVVLQDVLKEIQPQRLFDPKVGILLAGHVGAVNALVPKTGLPTQFVVGNGGVFPIVNDFRGLTGRGGNKLTGIKTKHMWRPTDFSSGDSILNNFSGFIVMERTPAKATDWKIEVYDELGGREMTCYVRKEKSECR